MPRDFPIPYDGLVGHDFFAKYKMQLNYGTNQLSITIPTESNPNFIFSVPLTSNALNFYPIIIPARSEIVAKMPSYYNSDRVCIAKELHPGIHVGNCLVRSYNGIFHINLLNSTEEEVILNDLSLDLEELSEFHVLHFNTVPNAKRNEILKSMLFMDHLNSEEKRSITEICYNYSDIFHLPDDTLTATETVKHKIPLVENTPPVFVKPYRLPEHQKTEINKEISKMLDDGIIRNSKSPYNSPLLIVSKKPDKDGNKRFRIVVDFRKLNDCTISDAFPLPNISEIFDQLGSSKYFSVIDLANGFHQVLLNEESKHLTAFSTPTGHYEYNRLPMGLKGSPATFQRLLNCVLSGLQGLKCLVYLDDIVIFGSSLKQHNERLIDVFDRLREHKLRLKPDKCQFLRKEVAYLGHLVSDDGIKPDPQKISAVKEFPTPNNVKCLQRFLGLASYYRRFIPQFSSIAKPLFELLKKDVSFIWSDVVHNSFEQLKEKLTNYPVLKYPDFNCEFNLTTDASGTALGAVLSQGDQDLPIAFASRTLNRAERNYSTIERELLAIVWSVNHFRPYLYGKKFNIYTDHKPLIYLFSIKDPSSRLMKFRLKLEEFEYEVKYKPGKTNNVADALSRSICYNKVLQNPDCDYNEYLQKRSNSIILNPNVTDHDTSIFRAAAESTPVIIITRDLVDVSGHITEFSRKFNPVSKTEIENLQLYNTLIRIEKNKPIIYLLLRESIHQKLLYENVFKCLINLRNSCIEHNITSLALPKLARRHDQLQNNLIRSMIRYIFKGTPIKVQIHYNRIIENISENERNKILTEFHTTPTGGHEGISRTYDRIKLYYKWENMHKHIKSFIKSCKLCQKNKSGKNTLCPMQLTTTASNPFQKIFLDIVGPLTPTYSNNKYLLTFQDDLSKYVIAIPLPNQEAATVAKAFVTKIICSYGIPQTLVTDQGTNFCSQLFKNTCKLLHIKHINCTSYHPQSNGALERSHRTLKEYLRSFIQSDQLNWDEFIPYACFTYNTTPHKSTNFTPFELLFGHLAELPSSIAKPPEVIYNYDDYASELKLRLQQCHEKARELLIKNKESSKTYYDRRVHDLEIQMGDKVLLKNETGNKLDSLYTGPYTVVSIDSPVNITILVKNKKVKVHKNRLKLFKD